MRLEDEKCRVLSKMHSIGQIGDGEPSANDLRVDRNVLSSYLYTLFQHGPQDYPCSPPQMFFESGGMVEEQRRKRAWRCVSDFGLPMVVFCVCQPNSAPFFPGRTNGKNSSSLQP